MAQTVKNVPAVEETGSIPGLRRSSGEGDEGYPLQYSYQGEFHEQWTPAVYSAWCHKEPDITEKTNPFTLLLLFCCHMTVKECPLWKGS